MVAVLLSVTMVTVLLSVTMVTVLLSVTMVTVLLTESQKMHKCGQNQKKENKVTSFNSLFLLLLLRLLLHFF